MYMKNLSTRLLALVAMVFAQVLTVAAATTISVSNLDITPGQQKDVTISISADQADIYQLDAFIALPQGLKLVANGNSYATTAALTQGYNVNLNAESGYLILSNFMMQPIKAANGAIATFRVEADETLEAGAITVSAIRAWHIGGAMEDVDVAQGDVTINVGSAELFFGEQEVNLSAGNSATVAVYMNNDAALTGFQAELVLPAGVSATVSGANRTAEAPSYTPATGMIIYFNGATPISGNQGVLFNITLTADNTFTADDVVTLTGITATTALSQSISADDITLTLIAKDLAAKEAADNIVLGLQEKLDAKVAEIANNYPDAANASELTDKEQSIQNDINNLQSKVDEDYDNNVLDANEIQTLATPIEEAIDALEALAAKLQGNEDGKKAIDDEIAELRVKLAEAWWICPNDLPEDVNKKLGEEYDGIEEAINELAAEYQALYDAVELSADATLDAEKKQAIVDAIDALIAKIKQWQRGDVEFDLDVDMDDFYALTDSILKENLPAKERRNAFYRFDANADEAINVGDMQGIVNICLGLKANGALFSRQSEQVKAELSVKGEATATGMRYTLTVSGMSYTGFQMDVKGAQVVSESSALTVRKSDNGSKTRILAIGMEQQEGQVVTIETTGSARLENVILTQADAQTVTFDLSGTTGISAVAAGQSAEKSYNLSGREVKQARGLVISGGKKMIRK